jgi:Zn-dependent alcohol dehydrogenase
MTLPGRTAVLPAGRTTLAVKELTFPDPAASQVIVRQYASGVCRSQLHEIYRGRTEDRLLGHESSVGGSCAPGRDFPVFASWRKSGQLELDSLAAARCKLDDINQACPDLAAWRIAGRAILDFTLG